MPRTILQAATLLCLLVGASACRSTGPSADPGAERPSQQATWISLTIRNGAPEGPLDLIAGQEYVFDRITLAVEKADISSSRDALDWLRQNSAFAHLNWQGVRETRAYWRNFRESRPSADIYAHAFTGAPWMTESNSLELSLLDASGDLIGVPLRLTNRDFLNHLKQQDYDMIKAEYRYEDFARHKDLGSARSRRTVAKIVLAVQTDLTKRLAVPANAHALRVVWDKRPQEPYVFPVRLVRGTYGYGGELHVRLDPEKEVYAPGDTIRATFTLRDQEGQDLKFSEFAGNGIRQVNIHLDGPVHDPTYYHEEWLSEFGVRYAYHLRAPALGLGTPTESQSTNLETAPLDPSGTQFVVDLHVPPNLPADRFGTYSIGATVRRRFASQAWSDRLEKLVQVGGKEVTRFEAFSCVECHVPNTEMDVGQLIPPMVGVEKLTVDSLQDCVMCHDNSRNGSRRLDKYLHLIHVNRETFQPKNDCSVCHLVANSIKKVELELCSACHEGLHEGNRAGYTDVQCAECHQDFSSGHVTPAPVGGR